MTSIRNRTIGHYLDTLGSASPAPGGGSVAGLVGALAAGLGQMVANLTINTTPHPELETALDQLRAASESLLQTAERDETAYPAYLAASRLPKSTPDEKAARRQAMQAAMVNAATIPLGIATAAADLLDMLEPIARHGTAHATSDTVIATLLAEASVHAALDNVRANVPLIKDEPTANHFATAANDVEHRSSRQATHLRTLLAST